MTYEFQCTSGNNCPLKTPFLCPDMLCKGNMSLCNDTHAARGFDTMEIVYPAEMGKENATRLKVYAEGKEFGETISVIVTVPLMAFYPDEFGIYAKEEFVRKGMMIFY